MPIQIACSTDMIQRTYRHAHTDCMLRLARGLSDVVRLPEKVQLDGPSWGLLVRLLVVAPDTPRHCAGIVLVDR
jgi:hypothetical protein